MIKDAIILAGGLGTRLRPLTYERPKPLLPVNNRPFLESQFLRLKLAGVRRVVLSVGYQAWQIKKALPKLEKFGLSIRVAEEKRALGTGGAIRFAWPDKSKACLVLNGDILSDANILDFQKAHAAAKAAATLWLLKVADTRAYGVVELDKRGQVSRFVEKPEPGQSKSHLINAGLYALEPEVLKLIPKGRLVSVEREVFPALLESGARVQGYADAKKPYWKDIGSPEAYRKANLDAAAGRVKLKGFWGTRTRGRFKDSVIDPTASVAKDARLKACVLLEGVRVGSGAKMTRVILGAGMIIEPGQRVSDGAVLSLKKQD